ncbi:fluoride efflux transporter CrcB [Thermoleptolyngbya oregonensis NK1-22]|uniref:Fluoride-specific ion channel FluC n=1 Tax=Thermoleptolyngbya oregonensis NK1-22 TaxID=2547457 RepID=A0AA96Y921_9CYAN|nr:fluoride efflux transporter CrcB [Thermoleptolyngbya oregonensis]WOB45094.1 fluoride efflux transporter CrcB [Thermoleptolyngbya oregonensis NK1-22]
MSTGSDSLPLTVLLISLGAVLGALSRYYVTRFCTRRFGLDFPVGTLLVNLSGSLLMGMAAGLFRIRFALPDPDHLLMVGFFGSYTTFSTYALDVYSLFRRRAIAPALLFWLGSPLAGFLCVELGIVLALWLTGGISS